jgi:chorismate synthase
MSGIWGNNIKISLFGESHGNSIGINVDGLEPGIELDLSEVYAEMSRRSPGKSLLSSKRKESDMPDILSGYFDGKTTGTPLCAVIKNEDKKSNDYSKIKDLARPGHADYTGYVKYNSFNDYRGGGHFSGRLTAPLVFCGAICKQILKRKGIFIGSHIKKINCIEDTSFDYANISKKELEELKILSIPVIDKSKAADMEKLINDANMSTDSVGGVVECAVVGIKPGVGDPFFDSVESVLSHLMFSIPSVKGIEFGAGFGVADMYGSECNDEFYIDKKVIKTKTNNNGGILGGITNGMPVIFKVAIKPTPSIAKTQNTVNFKDGKEEKIAIEGRHDPCIVQRALPVIEAVAAIGIYDLLKGSI